MRVLATDQTEGPTFYLSPDTPDGKWIFIAAAIPSSATPVVIQWRLDPSADWASLTYRMTEAAPSVVAEVPSYGMFRVKPDTAGAEVHAVPVVAGFGAHVQFVSEG